MRQALVIVLQRRRLLLAIGVCTAVQGRVQERRRSRGGLHAALLRVRLVLQWRCLEGAWVMLLLLLAWEAKPKARERCNSTHVEGRCARVLRLLWRATEALQGNLVLVRQGAA